MDRRHWTDRDFIDALYGVAAAEAAHLDECPSCRDRWTELQKRKAALTAEPEVSPLYLAAQRRAVYRRLDESRPRLAMLAPALAALAMLVVGFFLIQPSATAPKPAPKSDDAVFAEIYALEQSSEPAAASPVHALFDGEN